MINDSEEKQQLKELEELKEKCIKMYTVLDWIHGILSGKSIKKDTDILPTLKHCMKDFCCVAVNL